jgi:hypothetical protein
MVGQVRRQMTLGLAVGLVITLLLGTVACVQRNATVQEASIVNCMTHRSFVTAVAFSPNGQYVVSGSGDGTARVWWWRPKDLIAESCRRLPRNLTPEEWRQYVGPEAPYHATCPGKP